MYALQQACSSNGQPPSVLQTSAFPYYLGYAPLIYMSLSGLHTTGKALQRKGSILINGQHMCTHSLTLECTQASQR